MTDWLRRFINDTIEFINDLQAENLNNLLILLIEGTIH